jgi:hypothetical protein
MRAPYRRHPRCTGQRRRPCRLRIVTPYHSLDGPLIIPSGIATPPWSTTVQHGATLAGLVARAVELVPSAVPMHLARLTVDLTRATPLGPTRLDTTVVRNGKRLQLVDVTVLVNDQPYSRGQGLRIRTDDVVPADDLPPPWDDEPNAPTGPPRHPVASPLGSSPFLQSMSIRWESWQPGRGVCWINLGDWFVDDEPTFASTRAAVAADLVMTGGALLPDDYHVVNADIGMFLTRAPIGEDIRVSSIVRVDSGGHGISEGVMHDRVGRFGSVTKALLIDRQP